MELYGQVRRAVYVEGMSRREAARRFGIDQRTVAKMLAFSVPPGYRRTRPPAHEGNFACPVMRDPIHLDVCYFKGYTLTGLNSTHDSNEPGANWYRAPPLSAL